MNNQLTDTSDAAIQEVIDIHCHLINFDYLPDKYTIKLLKNAIGPAANLFSEKQFKQPQNINKGLVALISTLGIAKYLKELINAFCLKSNDGSTPVEYTFKRDPQVIDNLIQKGEYFRNKDWKSSYGKNRKGKLIMIAPLMMDFVKASYISHPTLSRHGVITYAKQIEDHAFLMARHPWCIFPLFHYHPYRYRVFDEFVRAFEGLGFIGVKLYPAMKYYPDHTSVKNDSCINNNLKRLYEYAKNHFETYGERIPITCHAQNNSTQAIDLSTKQTRKYTRIANWRRMIETYELKINFGHYGGPEFSNVFKPQSVKDFSRECRKEIWDLMATYNTAQNKQIFADTSAVENPNKKYFKQLNNDLSDPKRLIMFGTDLPVTTAVILNKTFVNRYIDQVAEAHRMRFFKTHAINFLFDKGVVPERYVRALKTRYARNPKGKDPLDPANLPSHIEAVQKKGKIIYKWR
jgi:predicted TIM-barrel fold metal-dependent hydrolase